MTPFDGRILWWHWQGSAVAEETITELAQTVTTGTPNASGIAIKTSNGGDWQGQLDAKASMAITGPEAISGWAKELERFGLETHLWCVVQGRDVEAEAARIVEACGVPGVRSMILDVEAGERYFGKKEPETVRALFRRVRAGISKDFHLGLCLFVDELDDIYVDEWLPHVGSLHPMVYHWDFSQGSSEPRPYLDEAFEALIGYNLPVVPILQTYPDPATNTPVPEAHIYQAGVYASQKGAAGISYFRLGAADDEAFSAISRIEPPRG